jgi:tetratricopeptide (TPR) repeat protein
MIKPKNLPKLASRTVTLFFFLLLLSKSTAASIENDGLTIAQQSTATSQDVTRAAARKAFDEGEVFYKQGTARSLRQAIVKLEEALKLWQQVGDKAGQAVTLLFIGRVYDLLGYKQQALNFYNQSLPLIHVWTKLPKSREFDHIAS